MFAIQAVGQDQALQFVGLETAVEELAQRAGQKAHQAADVVARHTAKPPPGFPQLADLAHAAGMQIGRRLEEEGLQVGCEAFQLVLGFKEARHVTRRNTLEFGSHPRLVAPPGNHVAVVEGGLHARIAGDHLQPVSAQFEILDDRRPQHACDVRGRGNATSRSEFGVDFFGHGTSADNVPALEHQYFFPGFREIRGRGQSVVAGADDDDIVLHVGIRHG